MVEALSINTDDSTLRNESVWVYLVDQLEDDTGFTLLSQYKQHLHFFARIEALSIDNGATTMRFTINTLAYLVIFVRYNKF